MRTYEEAKKNAPVLTQQLAADIPSHAFQGQDCARAGHKNEDVYQREFLGEMALWCRGTNPASGTSETQGLDVWTAWYNDRANGKSMFS